MTVFYLNYASDCINLCLLITIFSDVVCLLSLFLLNTVLQLSCTSSLKLHYNTASPLQQCALQIAYCFVFIYYIPTPQNLIYNHTVLQPSQVLFLISLLDGPSSAIINPKEQKISTFFLLNSCQHKLSLLFVIMYLFLQ